MQLLAACPSSRTAYASSSTLELTVRSLSNQTTPADLHTVLQHSSFLRGRTHILYPININKTTFGTREFYLYFLLESGEKKKNSTFQTRSKRCFCVVADRPVTFPFSVRHIQNTETHGFHAEGGPRSSTYTLSWPPRSRATWARKPARWAWINRVIRWHHTRARAVECDDSMDPRARAGHQPCMAPRELESVHVSLRVEHVCTAGVLP